MNQIDFPFIRNCVMLIGFPGTGKTTYRKEFLSKYKPVSVDDIVIAYAQANNMKYAEAFHLVVQGWSARKLLKALAKDGHNIVIDQTNLTVQSRMDRINAVREAGYPRYKYQFIGIHFDMPEPVILSNIEKRGDDGADHSVYNKLKETWEPLTESEVHANFDHFLKIDYDKMQQMFGTPKEDVKGAQGMV